MFIVLCAAVLCSLLRLTSANTDVPSAAPKLPIIHKCCLQGEIMNYTVEGCSLSDHSFEPPQIDYGKGVVVKFKVVDDYLASCDDGVYLYEEEVFQIWETGELITKNGTFIAPNKFCWEQLNSKNVPFFCASNQNKPNIKLHYPTFIIISIPFLLLTFIVYASIPKLQNLHGKCIMSYLSALTLSYICLTVINVASDEFNSVTCSNLGFTMQFLFLATFFWLNAMSFEIYRRFSNLRPAGGLAGKWTDRRKLLCYSAYAWGMPLLILAVTIAVDYTPSIPETFKPGMGLSKCFFTSRTANWLYFYGPMALIISVNLLLCVFTVINLHKNSFANRENSRKHGKDVERFILYLKLFIIMGTNWLFEVVSFTFYTDLPEQFWYVTDIPNALQGLFIFHVLIWNKRVWGLMKKQKSTVKGERTTRSHTSSNSTTRGRPFTSGQF